MKGNPCRVGFISFAGYGERRFVGNRAELLYHVRSTEWLDATSFSSRIFPSGSLFAL